MLNFELVKWTKVHDDKTHLLDAAIIRQNYRASETKEHLSHPR